MTRKTGLLVSLEIALENVPGVKDRHVFVLMKVILQEKHFDDIDYMNVVEKK